MTAGQEFSDDDALAAFDEALTAMANRAAKPRKKPSHTKSIYSRNTLKEALAAAVGGLKQEASSLAARGNSVNPHHVSNAEMSLVNVFTDLPNRATAVSRIANAHFGGLAIPCVSQAYHHGARAGMDRLDAAAKPKKRGTR
jgi:hypothetical protein